MLKKLLKYVITKIILRKNFERGTLVFGGHILFQTLRTAIQLDIFNLLHKEGPLTLKEIAEKLNLKEQPVRIILLGLCSSAFLKKSGERYSITYFAKLFFLKSSPYKITAYVELQHRVMYKGVYWLLESVQQNTNVGLREFKGTEPTLYQRLAHDPETEKIFQEAMEELSVYANSQLKDRLDLSKVKHLVDVGGGNGTNAMAIAKKWPHLRATVFDSPSVCEIAKENIKQNGLAERVFAVAGNCFNDPFPSDATAIMFCHFFTIWGKEKDSELLKKCFSALPKGGQVIIFNMMQNDDETGPLSAALGSPYFLSIATGLGMLYTWKEYEQWLLDAGFSSVKKHNLDFDHGIIVGIK